MRTCCATTVLHPRQPGGIGGRGADVVDAGALAGRSRAQGPTAAGAPLGYHSTVSIRQLIRGVHLTGWPVSIKLLVKRRLSYFNARMASVSERSISVGGDMIGSSAVTGDHNVVHTEYRALLQPVESVDIGAEVRALRELLTTLEAPEQAKLERALADAEDEAAKPEPDRDEIGGALDRAIRYATKANNFAEQATKLKPHLEAACSWLGRNWHKLLAAASLGDAL